MIVLQMVSSETGAEKSFLVQIHPSFPTHVDQKREKVRRSTFEGRKSGEEE